jgi:hypothetical protein
MQKAFFLDDKLKGKIVVAAYSNYSNKFTIRKMKTSQVFLRYTERHPSDPI